MPELPEVETVMHGLEPHMLDQTIQRVTINRYDLRGGIPDDFIQTVQGAKVTSLERRAKYIIAHLSRDSVFVLHLGMSGRVRIYNKVDDYIAEAHDHVFFDMSSGERIVYQDPRRFGMLYTDSADSWLDHKPFSEMGPEPLGNGFDGEYLYHKLQKRSGAIKPTLLDQKLVVGLGNIYVCEALFRAHISPLRAANSLTQEECNLLASASKDVLKEAIASGGSTLRDYKKADGGLGYFQHHFRTYGQEGSACTAQGCSGTIHKCVQAGRSTFYCPKCQL